MGEHAKYGGSTIKRTKGCPPWANFSKNLPNTSGPWADEGTLLHQAMQRIFTENFEFDAKNVVGMTYEGQTLTEALFEEMIEPAIEAVEDIFEKYNIDDFLCESRVIIDEGKEIWGSADLIGRGQIDVPGDASQDLAPGVLKVGFCGDYKFGRGTMVDAENNDQGLFYSVAASLTPATRKFFKGIDLLVIAIIQPNDRGRPPFTVWEVDAAMLEEEHLTILKACEVAEAANPKDPAAFKTGDHCDYCPGKGLCPPTSGELSAMLRMDVTAPDLIKKILPFKDLHRIISNAKTLLDLAETQIGEGVKIDGFKLVPKQSKRAYTDVEAVEAVVKTSRKLKFEETHASTLLPLTKMEKLFKKKKLDFGELIGPFIKKASPGTTLASDDDKRQAAPGLGAIAALLNRKN